MGEVLDFTKLGQVSGSQEMQVDEGIIKDAASLLGGGKPRSSVKLLLHNMGYSLDDAEKIVSKAEMRLYSKPKKKVNFALIFIAFVVALALASAVLYLVVVVSSHPADCGDDTFCVQKVIDCQPGSYQSSYRGITNEYRITNRGQYCQVFVRVLKSRSQRLVPGMSMNCLYPISDGKTDLSGGYSNCDGPLAGALMP